MTLPRRFFVALSGFLAAGILAFPTASEGAGSGETVFMTKFGPMTMSQYEERLRLDKQKQQSAAEVRREADERARAAKKAAEARREREAAEKKAADERKAQEALRAQREAEARKQAEADEKAEAARLKAEKKAAKNRGRTEAAQMKAAADAERKAADAERKATEEARRQAADAAKSVEPAPVVESSEKPAKEKKGLFSWIKLKPSRESEPSVVKPAPQEEEPEIAAAELEPVATEPIAEVEPNQDESIADLNQRIFDLVRLRNEQGVATERMNAIVEGTRYMTTKPGTPFHIYSPLQFSMPDRYLSTGTEVTVTRRGKIWCDVKLETGDTGMIATDFLEASPLPTYPDIASSGSSSRSGGSYKFEYTPIPVDYEPPALPESNGEMELAPLLPLLPAAQ